MFKDIPDLDDNTTASNEAQGRVSDVKDDWLVGEEFDVGPEFMRRQREEEERWKKKCDKWLGAGPRDQTAWRWAIRDMIFSDGAFEGNQGRRSLRGPEEIRRSGLGRAVCAGRPGRGASFAH